LPAFLSLKSNNKSEYSKALPPSHFPAKIQAHPLPSDDRVAAALAEAEKRRRSEVSFLKREKELKAQVAAERHELKQQLHALDINRSGASRGFFSCRFSAL
jgi:hypothetical protein